MPDQRKVETLSLAAIAKLLVLTNDEAAMLLRKKILVRAGKGQVATVASIQNYVQYLRTEQAKKQAPPKYTATDIAEWTGYTPRRIQQLIAEGVLPGEENGTLSVKKNIHALIAYLQMVAKQGSKSASEARQAKIQEETRWLRTRNLEKEKSLMPVALHKQLQSAIIQASKSRYLATPSRILDKVPARCPHCAASLDDVRKGIHEHAKVICTEALHELSEEKLDIATEPLKKRKKK